MPESRATKQYEGERVTRVDKTEVVLEVGSTSSMNGGLRATKLPKQGTWTVEAGSTGTLPHKANATPEQLRALAKAMDEVERGR